MDEIDALIAQLNSKDKDERARTIDRLVELKEESVPRLMRIVSDKKEDGDLRWFAAWAIDEARDERVVEELIRVLEDKSDDEYLKYPVASALVSIGTEKAIGAALKTVKDHSEDIRTREVTASYLKKGCFDKLSKNEQAHCLLVMRDKESLVAMGDDALPVLMTALETRDEMRYYTAVHTLAETNRVQIIPELLRFLEEEKSDLIYSAYEGILKLASKFPKSPEVRLAVPLLIHSVERKDGPYRREFAKILGEIGDERAIQALADAALNKRDFDMDLRKNALESLAKIAPETAFDVSASLYVNDYEKISDNAKKILRSIEMTKARIERLVKMRSLSGEYGISAEFVIYDVVKENPEMLLSVLKNIILDINNESELRINAVDLLRFFAQNCVPLLENLTKDKDENVRAKALDIHSKFARSACDLRLKIGMLTDASMGVKVAAIGALAETRDPEAVKALAELLENPELRNNAIFALSENAIESSIPILIQLCHEEPNFSHKILNGLADACISKPSGKNASDAVPQLAEGLSISGNEDMNLRHRIVKALRAIAENGGIITEAVSALATVLLDKEPTGMRFAEDGDVRQTAYEALCKTVQREDQQSRTQIVNGLVSFMMSEPFMAEMKKNSPVYEKTANRIANWLNEIAKKNDSSAEDKGILLEDKPKPPERKGIYQSMGKRVLHG